MPVRRMALQIGMGTDIRGGDSTKAAVRAVRDAIHRNALSVAKICGKDPNEMIVDVRVGVPEPERVDHGIVLSVLPYGVCALDIVAGGLKIPTDDGSDSTLVAHAAIVVKLDISNESKAA